MRYFHSNKNFNQYKPELSFWEKMKKKNQKREVLTPKSPDILANPFKREAPKPKSYKKILFTTIVLVIFFGWPTLMLTLPYFKINNINIVGTKISKPQEVEDYVRYGDYFKDGLLSRKNYFLFPQSTVAKKIQDKFLYQNVEIKKVFPNSIQIIVTEKPASIIYDNNGIIFLLDQDGKIIKKTELSYSQTIPNAPILNSNASSTLTTPINPTSLAIYEQTKAEYGNFPIINDPKPINTKNEGILSAKLIIAAQMWQKYLKEQGVREVKFFSTDETDFNLKITTDKPWHILINTENDASAQMRNLKTILISNNPTNYVDLRFGERVYWK